MVCARRGFRNENRTTASGQSGNCERTIKTGGYGSTPDQKRRQVDGRLEGGKAESLRASRKSGPFCPVGDAAPGAQQPSATSAVGAKPKCHWLRATSEDRPKADPGQPTNGALIIQSLKGPTTADRSHQLPLHFAVFLSRCLFVGIGFNHRYEAARSLGWEEIDAIVGDFDDLDAELVMIDENLCRAGLTGRLWSMEENAEMIDATLPRPGRPATYRKREAA